MAHPGSLPHSKPPQPGSAGAVLRLIRERGAMTRAELARQTGLARSTVTQRIEVLLEHGLVYEAGDTASTGGRPPGTLAFNDESGIVLCADLGATHSRFAACDLGGEPLSELSGEMDIAQGPDEVLDWAQKHFVDLLTGLGRKASDVQGIGVGVPGPVAFESGQPTSPPIMPGWDGFWIPGWFAAHYDAAVLVDNDVNIMALGEHWTNWRDREHLMFIKVGTGIGCGIVANGAIHRGDNGAAGDIGHIRLVENDSVLCRCGNTGCLEAVSGGRALAQRLSAEGIKAATTRDVVLLVRSGDPAATRLVREAGRNLGQVLAGCVNFFNPGVIIIGGDLAQAPEQLLAGVREVTFRRSLPLATEGLRIVPSGLGDRAGVIGAAIMAIEHVLAPDAVDQVIRRGLGV